MTRIPTTTSARAELEHLLTIPPPATTQQQQQQQQRHIGNMNPIATAHAALQHLRDTGDPHHLFLRTILEIIHTITTTAATAGATASSSSPYSSKDEELLFHCITGCRQVFLLQWTVQYSPAFLILTRNAFAQMGHVLGGATAARSRTCQLACYTTAVAFWKRAWNDNTNWMIQGSTSSSSSSSFRNQQEAVLAEQMQFLHAPRLMHPKDLLTHMEQLLLQQQQQQQQQQTTATTQAALFLTCLIGEFVGKSVVTYRMPLEFHKEAHASFEKQGALRQCLTMSLHALSQQLQQQQQQQQQQHYSSSNNNNNDPTAIHKEESLTCLQAVVDLVSEVVSWEFGASAWTNSAAAAAKTGQTLIRPPIEWREYLVQPDLARAVFRVHLSIYNKSKQQKQQQQLAVAQSLRQLLLILASLSGSMFAQQTERQAYATCFVEGTLELLQVSMTQLQKENACLLDTLQLVARAVSNFRLSTLVSLPSLAPLLQSLTTVGMALLKDQVADCERAGGDVECMEYREWREEALALILEGAVLLCGDPWLLYSGSESNRREAQRQLSTVLGPLYEGFVQARTRLAALEEHFVARNEEDLDEVREQILETSVQEELASVATIGRLHLSAAIQCLSHLFAHTMPQLEALWHASGDVTPDTAALFEQARLLNLHITSLLTDDNEGEAPAIPDAVMAACQEHQGLTSEISAAVQALFQFAEKQVHKIAQNPSNLRLSPMLASSFLLFLNRWAPAYIYPSPDNAPRNGSPNPILQKWSTPETAQQAVSFCMSLCLHYQAYWPQEKQIQEYAAQLLMSLAKRGGHVRTLMVKSPVFQQLVQFHCLTAGIRHSATRQEFESEVRSKGGDAATASIEMIWGYHRLPYDDKSRILTAILVACSDTSDALANKMINESLKVIHDAFTGLIHALSSKKVSFEEIHAKEMACLCIDMLCGVAHASEMSNPERIPQLLTGYLPQLSGLMMHYADDLTICETLLGFFRDYTEYFIASLDRDQSLALFNASAELLKSYSAQHCASRRIVTRKSSAEAEAEEEQTYNDILCALQLLINLGTKDFIDACSTDIGVDSSQVTDMIFFGLQQILPLMTQGLLQFPSLCSVFFDLIGFMNDTYPEKVCALPYELFNNLLESLLFGMSHHDASVAKSSLFGLASIAKEHLSSQALKPHLDTHPGIFTRCSRRLLTEVIFQQVVVDRIEAAGMALLPLAAVDVHGFSQVVQELKHQVPDPQQQMRLDTAFSTLIQPEALAKVSAGGYEGRLNRAQFKKRFEEFVNEVHSFLVLR